MSNCTGGHKSGVSTADAAAVSTTRVESWCGTHEESGDSDRGRELKKKKKRSINNHKKKTKKKKEMERRVRQPIMIGNGVIVFCWRRTMAKRAWKGEGKSLRKKKEKP